MVNVCNVIRATFVTFYSGEIKNTSRYLRSPGEREKRDKDKDPETERRVAEKILKSKFLATILHCKTENLNPMADLKEDTTRRTVLYFLVELTFSLFVLCLGTCSLSLYK